ncbi:MAG TPA: hypothetical protein VNG34_11720 [Actinomycetota bacterium]|jgi:hypothetical protein|nr:hypothetical protein [Actinomycetota bacterium]
MDAPLPRVRRAPRVDLGGSLGYLAALWGTSLVVRGGFVSLCPGCDVDALSIRSIVIGLVLLMGVGAFLWSRDLRGAALLVTFPGMLAGVAVTLVGPSFAVVGLLAVPVACSAAAAGVRRRERWDRAAVVWTFAAIAVLGSAGTGLLALAASSTVVACVVLGPDPDRFLIPPPKAIVNDPAGP